MEKTPDLCIQKKTEGINQKAQELGWKDPESYSTYFIKAENWGELKKKIQRNRENHHVLVFLGGDEKLNRKATSDPRIDILLHPEKNRKDSGLDRTAVKQAAENNVAIGFDLSQLLVSPKKKVQILSKWRKNLRLCEKHDTKYLITTTAKEKYDLRAPRDLKSIIDSLDYSGKKAIETHEKILSENLEKPESTSEKGVKYI